MCINWITNAVCPTGCSSHPIIPGLSHSLINSKAIWSPIVWHRDSFLHSIPTVIGMQIALSHSRQNCKTAERPSNPNMHWYATKILWIEKGLGQFDVRSRKEASWLLLEEFRIDKKFLLLDLRVLWQHSPSQLFKKLV